MTNLHTVNDLDELPVGAEIEDREGDTATHLGNGVWSVTGFAETVWSSFFRFPVALTSPSSPLAPENEVIRTISALDALPNGSVIVGIDALRLTFVKQGGHWIDPTKRPGDTYNVRAFVHARRWGFKVGYRPQYV
ncbi:hypothetical protein SEA_YOSIF_64 [Streptomyces phage Yosif]|uniref:Uncharacterized protein n=1 Tax=Streptomyces phage Yosif TaxID=2201421 RepID=A0A2Z4QCD8_9CAUD|nr:hypothetical protein KGG71_gp64 [Streptomyces phage Yosif]AWY07628.1 hypothetical protein SEA_YOSIF_64 [Streptomyces phage Yosif]